MLVAFRADASLDIGTGHVMRCLTLARQFKAGGDECLFICRAHEGNLIAFLESEGVQVISLPASDNVSGLKSHLSHGSWLRVSWQQDAEETLQAISNYKIDCLVVDHYALDIFWEQELHRKIKNIFVIDDLADRKHDAFALLDQNYGRENSDYDAWLSDKCVRLIGPKFALLRPEFSELRALSLQRRSEFRLETILVNLGGVDQDNFTCKIIDALAKVELENTVEVIVVLGTTNPNAAEVKGAAEASPYNISVKIGVANMAELMAKSDLAIGAAGSTTWERFSLGLPSVLLSIADNQDSALNALAESDCIYKLSVDTIAQDLKLFFEQSDVSQQLRGLSFNGRELCDAFGARKVKKIIRDRCEG